MYDIRGTFGSPFDKALAYGLLKSREKRATELAVAQIGAGGRVATSRGAAKPRTMTTGRGEDPEAMLEAGRMERARMGEAATERGLAAEVRAGRERLGLETEIFEFEKSLLKKKKKKKGAVEEIMDIAVPRS